MLSIPLPAPNPTHLYYLPLHSLSYPSPQLASTGLVNHVFSLCFGFPSGGTMLLGDVPLPPGMQPAYTPLLRSSTPYYVVQLDSISVGGSTLSIEPVRRGLA